MTANDKEVWTKVYAAVISGYCTGSGREPWERVRERAAVEARFAVLEFRKAANI